MPGYSRSEMFADGCVHVVGVIGGFVAITALMIMTVLTKDGLTVTSVAIYSAATMTVFIFSALYNMDMLPSRREVMRRLDHAAIFVKIAGTYTPFAVISLGGGWGVGVLGAVWSIAAIGVPLQLLAPDRVERAAVGLYLLQGWLVVLVIGPLSEALSSTVFWLLVAGGGLYTVGVIFFLAEKLPYHNAIWHAFVLAASCCMYLAVMFGIAAA